MARRNPDGITSAEIKNLILDELTEFAIACDHLGAASVRGNAQQVKNYQELAYEVRKSIESLLKALVTMAR